MDARQQRGMELAATRTITKGERGFWAVPSQASAKAYRVNFASAVPTCSCPDFETRQLNCKHIFAVTYVMQREESTDGSTTVTETVIIKAETRKTYPQNWTAYNAAQTCEQDRFQELLRDLCAGIPQPAYNKRGRPSLPLADAVFSAAFKVYSTVSGRRFMSDLRGSHERGFISQVPHYNSIFNYLENAALTPILKNLIIQTSMPLKAVETDFAVDSSGFTTSRFHRWFDHKYGRVRQKHEWVKVHLMCGVKTHIVTAVEIEGKDAGDSLFLTPMLATTARNFKVAEVSADKGYGSRKNVDAITALGATPFIALKDNNNGSVGGKFQEMYHYFMYRRQEFLSHYHKRSNVESTFSMMKRKFGDSIRSKTDTAMTNETLCKVLCHNLVVLIHEMQELGIEATFWPKTEIN